jgi:hypothetical protein
VKKRLPSARALEERLRDFLDEFRPPTRSEIGNEVALWKKKRGDVLQVPKRLSGSFGQLESTEVVHGGAFASADVTPVMGTVIKGRSVEVAHALDDTQWELGAPHDEVTDPSIEAPTGSNPVILAPDLDAVAARIKAKKKRKRKR